eukprot:CAMPEP_0116555820 /NCGR_PEP_ID=MMETSP0397-20121206/8356_1 /TAXON_ID=216820 /ORGANISM="Cyclophora tenuis, Strain ECT3854" /LENGTH=110 /DNA_ID=CAMNT_0004081127 /DNA_START=49 /DNA_END=381 /DNA_ORIENTATION=+
MTSCVNVKDGTLVLQRKSFLRKQQTKYKYNPVGAGYSKIGKSIVTRRIMCDLAGGEFKLAFLPKLSRKRKETKPKGHLDFVYLDKDMRVTTNEKGEVSVHLRPDFKRTIL